MRKRKIIKRKKKYMLKKAKLFENIFSGEKNKRKTKIRKYEKKKGIFFF